MNKSLYGFSLIALLLSGSSFGQDTVIPGDIRSSIQSTSRAVLAAKHSVAPDPQVDILRARLSDMRQACIKRYRELAVLNLSTVITLNENVLVSGAGNMNGRATTASRSRVPDPALRENVGNRLNALREARITLQSRSLSKSTRSSRAMAKVSDRIVLLEQEVEQALAAPLPEQEQRLRQLAERLSVRPLRYGKTIDDKPKTSILNHTLR